jgi:hypothetical protein
MTMLNSHPQETIRTFRWAAARTIVLALLLGACGGAGSEDTGQSSALSTFSGTSLSAFRLICKPSGPRGVLLRLSTGLQQSAPSPRLLSTAPEAETTEGKLNDDAAHDEPASGDQPGALLEHLEHIASKDSIIGAETCTDFKVTPNFGSILFVRTSRESASLRYSPDSKLPWCFAYDDPALSVSPGDAFSLDVYAGSPTEVCSPVDSK